MSETNVHEMTHEQLIDEVTRLRQLAKGDFIIIEDLRKECAMLRTEKMTDFQAKNRSIGAIYKMVELVKDTNVPHAQREGNFLLLLAYIDKACPSHSAKFNPLADMSDLPF